MNLHLYKVWRIDDSDPNDPCESVIVMTEKDLRKEFMMAYNEGGIPQELIDDFSGDPDYCDEFDDNPKLENLKIGTIIDIMNEICDYIPGVGYYITETDVEVELNRAMVDKWLDVLNYWDDEVREAAERANDMRMYNEYANVINDIYRMTKGV